MKIFEYSNTSGEIFHCKFTTKAEKEKAWIKMFKYYNSNSRLHPLKEFLEQDNPDIMDDYNKAKKSNIPAIKRILNHMWETTDLSSFYGKVINIR